MRSRTKSSRIKGVKGREKGNKKRGGGEAKVLFASLMPSSGTTCTEAKDHHQNPIPSSKEMNVQKGGMEAVDV